MGWGKGGQGDYLESEDGTNGVEIFLNDMQRKGRCAEINPFQRLAEVGGTGGDGDDATVVDVFTTMELDGSVVDGIQLEAQQPGRYLASQAAREVVDQKVDVHGRLRGVEKGGDAEKEDGEAEAEA